MDQLMNLLKLLYNKYFLLLGGAFFCLQNLLIYSLLPSKIKARADKLFDLRYDYIATVLIVFFVFIGVLYLFYPNYLTHIEPSIASYGSIMQKGEILYPAPDPYPYYGIVYGPALAEIQFIFQSLRLPILIASKLPGLIAFVVFSLILFHLNKTFWARGYLIYLIPLGVLLFWNRPDSFLLLIVCLALLLGEKFVGNKFLPVLLGILAGAASAFKIHGIIYVFVAYLAIIFTTHISISFIVLFSICSLLSFFTFFVPQNVSFFSFIDYVEYAGVQGLSLSVWLGNVVYLIFLNLPVFFIAWNGAKLERNTILILFIILGFELIITIIAASPGSGAYHLLPFIPINAYIINRISEKSTFINKSLMKVLYASLIIPSLITSVWFFYPMAKYWRQFSEAQKEIMKFDKKYPGLIMGLTSDSNGYRFVYLYVILKNTQIDYQGYMDLQYSGVGDEKFAENLNNCNIENILLPNNGPPFYMNNYYTKQPLFSENIRQAFKQRYTLSENGEYFSVYTCSPESQL